MKGFRTVFQIVIIVDSLLLLALEGLTLVPLNQNLLPLAGLLAGLNAALHSQTLPLTAGLRRALLGIGLGTIVLMAAAVTRFNH